jgi:hypothetical protein
MKIIITVGKQHSFCINSETHQTFACHLATARLWSFLIVAIDLDLIGYVRVDFLVFFACKCVLGDCLERLFDIDCLFGACFEVRYVVLLLAPLGRASCVHCAAIGQVDLVADDDKRKVFRVPWRCLYEKLVAPALQILERLRRGDIVAQNAAVGATVERHAQALESLLTSLNN